MTDFDHDAGFQAGDLSGNLDFGKYDAYKALLHEVLEDGLITPDERERLEQAADRLGLDRGRLTALEGALKASYESRSGRAVLDVSSMFGAPATPAPPTVADPPKTPRASTTQVSPEDDAAPAPAQTAPSVMTATLESEDLKAAADAARQHAGLTKENAALAARVAELEAQLAALETELEEARAHVAVEVDLSSLSADLDGGGDDIASLALRVKADPRDATLLHALFRAHAGALDHQWCVAAALAYLGEANDEEAALHAQHKPEGLIQPTSSIDADMWRRALFHPHDELVTGEILSLIASPVLLGHVAALQSAGALPKVDPKKLVNPDDTTIQAARSIGWAGQILGLTAPPLYADTGFDGLVQMVPGIPPCSRLGQGALSGRSSEELAFIAGRHLALYRQERFIRLLVPNIVDLEDLFLAALAIGNPKLPLGPDAAARVKPIAAALEPLLEPVEIDALRGAYLRFVDDGGRTNLQRWAHAADGTAMRAGFLLAGDFSAAERMLTLEGLAEAEVTRHMNDLLVFATGERYPQLRRAIGIAIEER